MRAAGPVDPRAITVAGHLPTHRPRITTQPPGDRTHRLTRRQTQRDLLPLGEGQTPALQIPSPPWSDPSVHRHPPGAPLAVRPSLSSSTGDELTPLHRRPKRLHRLSDHRLRE